MSNQALTDVAAAATRLIDAVQQGATPQGGSLTVVGTGIRAITQLTVESLAAMASAEVLLHVIGEPIQEEAILSINPNAQTMTGFYADGLVRNATYEAMVQQVLASVAAGKADRRRVLWAPWRIYLSVARIGAPRPRRRLPGPHASRRIGRRLPLCRSRYRPWRWMPGLRGNQFSYAAPPHRSHGAPSVMAGRHHRELDVRIHRLRLAHVSQSRRETAAVLFTGSPGHSL